MKTGRLTTKTTPPDKYIITSKRETVKPRELTSKEAKYNSDVEAGEKYKSEQASYEKKSKAYNEDKALSAGKRLYSEFGGKGAVDLSPEGLKRFNVIENERSGLTANRIQRPKDTGSEDEYLSKLEKKGGYIGYVDYEKPVAPKKPSAPNERDMPMGRLPMNKISKVSTTTKGNFKKKDLSAPKKSAFVNPAKNVKRKDSVDMNPFAAGARSKGAGERYVRQVVNSIGKTGDNNRGYKKEEKRFKAYAGTTATGDSFQGMLPGEIKAYREKAKSARAEYKKQPASDVKAMGKAAMTSEIRQSRKAEKFAKAAYKPGGVKFFTDKKYGGNIEKGYRESNDNAVIRDNMDAKLKAIGAKESKRLADIESSTRGGFQYNSPIR
jgi:hypothetical protein